MVGDGTKERPYGAMINSKHSCCGGMESCIGCIHTVNFGRLVYCTFCPQGCVPHDIIKGSRNDRLYHGCVWCKHYCKKINSVKCSECLSASELVNFELLEEYKDDEQRYLSWLRNTAEV